MSEETVIYLTNIVIAAILSLLLTHFWWRRDRSDAMRFWMLSAWVLTFADVLFAARPILPDWASRLFPTVLVTVGQAGLLFAVRRAAGSSLSAFVAAVGVAVHFAGLLWFIATPEHSEWRKVFNGVVWAGFSFACWWSLRRAAEAYWRPVVAPANVFLAHGLFHCVRLGLGSWFALEGWQEASDSLQIVGNLEVSFFMVALFVGILMANLEQRNTELREALTEVQTLSGLLPICAWCKKVRDDDGYWRKVEDYFATHSQIKFTHGICTDCFDRHAAGDSEPSGHGSGKG
jgi:hypothetical protein